MSPHSCEDLCLLLRPLCIRVAFTSGEFDVGSYSEKHKSVLTGMEGVTIAVAQWMQSKEEI